MKYVESLNLKVIKVYKLYKRTGHSNIHSDIFQAYICSRFQDALLEIITQSIYSQSVNEKRRNYLMTDRQQAFYDYLETKEHNRRTEEEQRRHDQEVERLTAENQAEAARSHQASEAIARESNAIAREYNQGNLAIGQQNANTNAQNANTNERQASTAEKNAQTQADKVMYDYINASNANMNQARKINLDYEIAKGNLNENVKNNRRNYEINLGRLNNAQQQLDLAWKEYEMNKNDKTWNNVLKSVQTFNSTADTWSRILGLSAPSKTIRINQTLDTNGKVKWNGKITLRDIATVVNKVRKGVK